MERRIVVVTGGSRGIGAATARLAAARGHDVVLGYVRDGEAAAGVVADCRASGARAVAVRADVADEQEVVALFDVAMDELGRVDVVVNNAGILHRAARLEDFTRDRLDEVVAVNVVGAILVAREGVRRMSTRFGGRGGAIVNVSSAASYLGSPDEFIDYAATKGAMDTMTIGLAKEVAADNIRVNAVRPGLIHTDIHASSGIDDRIGKLVGHVPMQRGGTADEVAETILWLGSEAASYVTGALVNCSGGR